MDLSNVDKVVVSDDWTKNWHASIAVKITSIVLWAIIVVVFLVSIVLLKDLEQEIQADFEKKADQIAYQIAMLWDVAPTLSDEELGEELQARYEGLGFTGFTLSAGDQQLQVGHVFGQEHSILRRVPMSRDDGVPINVRAYHPAPSELARLQRNQLVIGLFAVLLLFGIFLTWAIRATLHRPMQILVNATKGISEGDQSIRLSVERDDEFGTLSRFFNEMLDQLMQQQDALQQALEEAESASTSKSAFLANMSHELRTPLNAIIGYSEMLQEEARDKGQKGTISDLQRIHTAGRHLLALINGILDLSKIEAGKMDLDVGVFDISAMIQDVVSTIHPIMDMNHNRLTVHCEPDIGDMEADQTKVRQALFNLLSNAAKFTERGTVILSVDRMMEKGTEWLRFSVEDTGIGIQADHMGRLFQDFSQIDSSTSRKYAGTGLGLAISRRYCQMMGGDIEAQSVVGKGSAFTIQLPSGMDISGNAVEPLEQKADSRTGPVQNELPHMSAPLRKSVARGEKALGTVLVIDDDSSAREVLKRHLGREGYKVHEASSGKEGLMMARELRPDVITLDVRMPDLDGRTVLDALKQDDQMAGIPVVMVSMEDSDCEWMRAGAVEFLTKPIDRAQLAAIVERCVEKPEEGKILVVDDNKNTRNIIRRTLEEQGFQVEEAADGRAAIERVDASLPALILLDLVMPRMNGFEFVEALRSRESTMHVPVVVMTALELSQDDRNRLGNKVEKIVTKSNDLGKTVLGQIRGYVDEAS